MPVLPILIAIGVFAILTYRGLRSVQQSQVTTALDRSSAAGRVTGRLRTYGYGQPLVYLQTADYREDVSGDPDPDDATAVREAGQELLAGYDSSGRKWNPGALVVNLAVYLVFSIGITGVLYLLGRALGL